MKLLNDNFANIDILPEKTCVDCLMISFFLTPKALIVAVWWGEIHKLF